jgi:hypothetical protein
MDELLALINDAAASHNWPVVAGGVAVLAVPIVLKALGKSVPGLDQLTKFAVDQLKKVKPPAPKPEEQPENQPGISNVVHIDKAREDKGPRP